MHRCSPIAQDIPRDSERDDVVVQIRTGVSIPDIPIGVENAPLAERHCGAVHPEGCSGKRWGRATCVEGKLSRRGKSPSENPHRRIVPVESPRIGSARNHVLIEDIHRALPIGSPIPLLGAKQRGHGRILIQRIGQAPGREGIGCSEKGITAHPIRACLHRGLVEIQASIESHAFFAIGSGESAIAIGIHPRGDAAPRTSGIIEMLAIS